MHHCLYVSEILNLILESIGRLDDHQESRVRKKTLASLARTCHALSPPALDALWRDLDGFDPFLNIFPVATSFVDGPQWSSFRKYAKRVKTFRGHGGSVSVLTRRKFMSSLQHYPEAHLPLFPNVIELEWSEFSFSPPEDSGISLLRYLSSPAVTTITLSLTRWLVLSTAELAVLADLPRLYPNVTSFTIVLRFSWDYEPSGEVGSVVTQWPRLRTLRTCGIQQFVMDQLLSGRTLESLHIDYHKSSPVYVGRIPATVHEVTLDAESLSACTRFLETVHASPTSCRLLIGMNGGQKEEDIEEVFRLLPHRLDTSHLRSLAIQPRSCIVGIPMWRTLILRGPLMSMLTEFTALHELDLDLLCTARISDAEYDCLAGSLRHLRSLKLGTANPSTMWQYPLASVRAVIAVVKHCKHLETLHIVFNGSILPPGCPTMQDSKEVPFQGVLNRRITELRVGCSPMGDGAVEGISSCLNAIMPCLVRIECKAWDKEWRWVQSTLKSCRNGRSRVLAA